MLLRAFSSTEKQKFDVVVRQAFSSNLAAKDFQEEAVLSFVRRRHTCVLAPMGAGKSMIMTLCLLWTMQDDPDSMMICIYPLI
jgi:ATP-dependent helicase YprA (DUF1998 family)